jgi:hypothetical protein
MGHSSWFAMLSRPLKVGALVRLASCRKAPLLRARGVRGRRCHESTCPEDNVLTTKSDDNAFKEEVTTSQSEPSFSNMKTK